MTDRGAALDRLARLPDTVTPDQAYVVEPFAPADAEGVAELFYRVYGGGYPLDMYYDPKAIRAAAAAKRLHPVVARLPGGQIAGFASLYASSPPFPGLMEFGLGMVHPLYRGSLILFHLCNAASELLDGLDGVAAAYGEAVCDTIITQHVSSLFGYRESALELDLMPGTGTGRISCLVMTRTIRDQRRQLFVAARYADQAAWLAETAGLDREIVVPDAPVAGTGSSRITTQVFSFASVIRINVFSPGQDFPEAAAGIEAEGQAQGLGIFQWFVDATHPLAAQAISFLRQRGCVFCGLIPRWFDGDAWLMQKNECEPDYSRIHLYSDTARAILDMIRSDRDAPGESLNPWPGESP